MTPKLNGIDHIHLYVSNRDAAEKWYEEFMGMKRIEALTSSVAERGPLILSDADAVIQFAVFEQKERAGVKAVAFRATGDEYLAWKSHLERNGLELRVADHKRTYSLYFSDPDQNIYEITTHDHEFVRKRLR